MAAGRKSPVSLYRPDIATMEADPTQAYDQGDATGFIRLNALRLKVASKVAAKVVAGGKKPVSKKTPAKKRK
jgi:argininosuccinate synthase